MRLLSAPFDGTRAVRESFPRAPCAGAAAAATVLVAAGLGLERWSEGLAAAGRGLASGAVHGGFVALGWILATGGGSGWPGRALGLGLVPIAASVAARVHAWGALAFLAVPALLVLDSRRREELQRIGVATPTTALHAVAGLAVGTFLGVHLLVTASLTFGYGVRISTAASYLAAVAYDVGANAVSAEWLFRGALFTRWWRRWAFWPAALLSTGLILIRYLVDPALPAAVEVRAGTVFYMGLLGLASCALRAWSGSLLPGYLSTVAFFAAYRTLSA